MRHTGPILATTLLAASGMAAQAQTVLSGDHSITGSLCAGTGCTASESFASDIKVKSTVPTVRFDDSSTPSATTRDWDLIADGRFQINDVDGSGGVFVVLPDAPQNTLYINDQGDVGLGTSMPQARLHLTDPTLPVVLFERTSAGGGTPYIWGVGGDDTGFAIADFNTNRYVFSVAPGAPEDALTIADTGYIGVGNYTPTAAVHVQRSDGGASIRVDETSPTSAPRTLLNLQNNGRPEIVMGNSSTGGEWSFGAGTNFVLKQGAVGSASAAKTKHLTVYASGDMEISGQIITGGPTCGAGCDAVFSADYALPSIEQHAEAMFALGHLPNVGPTAPGAPLNMSEQFGKLLNELEHAHIYIAEQQDKIAALHAENADQDAAIAELRAIISQMQAQN